MRVAACADAGLVQGFFVSDRIPGDGEPAAETIAGWVLEHGGEPIVSLSLAAQNRVEALGRVRAWREMGRARPARGDRRLPGRGQPGTAIFSTSTACRRSCCCGRPRIAATGSPRT